MDNVTVHRTCIHHRTILLISLWTYSTVQTTISKNHLIFYVLIPFNNTIAFSRFGFPETFSILCKQWVMCALLKTALNVGHPRLLQVLDTQRTCVTHSLECQLHLFFLELILVFAFYMILCHNPNHAFLSLHRQVIYLNALLWHFIVKQG